MNFLKTEVNWWKQNSKESSLFYKELFLGNKENLKMFLKIAVCVVVVMLILVLFFAFTVLPELWAKPWFAVIFLGVVFIFHMWWIPGCGDKLRKERKESNKK